MSMERTTYFFVANTRVLRGLRNSLSYSGLRFCAFRWRSYGVAKWPLSGCDKAHFRSWYGLYWGVKWAFSQCEMGNIARAAWKFRFSVRPVRLWKRLFCIFYKRRDWFPFSISRNFFVKIFYFWNCINIHFLRFVMSDKKSEGMILYTSWQGGTVVVAVWQNGRRDTSVW